MGSQRVFACAYDWPGWCRSGKDEKSALAALATYAPRYAPVAREARIQFKAGSEVARVREHLRGGATTDFGAPEKVAAGDVKPLAKAEAARLASLVNAAWVIFDRAWRVRPPPYARVPAVGDVTVTRSPITCSTPKRPTFESLVC